MSNNIPDDRIILSGLVLSDDFVRKVLPFLKEEYFHDKVEKTVFGTIKSYLLQYKQLPKRTALSSDVAGKPQLNERESKEAAVVIEDIYSLNVPELELAWLLEKAEKFCQSKAIYNAIQTSIAIYNQEEKDLTPHAIPDLVKDALGVCFDSHIGMDLFDSAEDRHDYYTKPENKIPFDLEILNKITGGGCGKKTLNVVVAPINCFVGSEEIEVYVDDITLKKINDYMTLINRPTIHPAGGLVS